MQRLSIATSPRIVLPDPPPLEDETLSVEANGSDGSDSIKNNTTMPPNYDTAIASEKKVYENEGFSPL